MSKTAKAWLWIIIIIVVAGGVYLAIRSRQANTQATAADTTSTNSVSMSDQEADSLSMSIDSVTLAAPGFVVFHEDSGNQPGKVVAVSPLLPAGISTHVPIVANLNVGTYYWAMLHLDNGNGVFSETTDPIATGSDRQPAMVRFMVKGIVEGAAKG